MSKPDGGPAFPVGKPKVGTDGIGALLPVTSPGLTVRDYFAAAALQGLCANPRRMPRLLEAGWKNVAQCAYAVADAMLAERDKG